MLQPIPGRYSSLEAGPAGTLHLAFYDFQNGDLRYAVRSAAGEWAFETVDSAGDVGWFASLELDANGTPHIAYAEFYDFKLKYAVRCGPDNWAIEVVDSSPGRGWYSSLALDSEGTPHIAYSGSHEWDLLHAWHTAAGWQFETVDSPGDVGFYCALAANSSDALRISYFDATGKRAKFAWQQVGGTWSTEVIDDSGDTGLDTALALDDQDHPHVAYWDRGNEALKYAWHDGDHWQTETVEAGTDCGYEASIIWAAGPRISYEGTLGVHYAEKLGSAWQIWQVDRTGFKCGDTALVLEAGQPRITYLNYQDGGTLYYAEGVDMGDPDDDGDGIPNGCDLCPDTIPNALVDEWGCPPEIPGDLNRDGDVDADDLLVFIPCTSGPTVPQADGNCVLCDIDADGDVDQSDFGILQRCYSGEDVPAAPNCAD